MNSSEVSRRLRNRDREIHAPLISIAESIDREDLRSRVCNRLVEIAQKRREEVKEGAFFNDWRIQLLFEVYMYICDGQHVISGGFIVAEDLCNYINRKLIREYPLRKEAIGRVLGENRVLLKRQVKWRESENCMIQKTCYLVNREALAQILRPYEEHFEPYDEDQQINFYIRVTDNWDKKKRIEERERKKQMKGELII
jgi:hypothetical protein